ncbi:glycosyltransferase family 2 protein [Aplosporella prunicola CBS 121167]|uniref:Chitin synthase n=1 Tax=Aplosporella prunicola CBS 121167 TaxID=1176127 RepID=A0A6A6B4M6_9PEZI|nr:glycosyltransferase family 2 protein [Aplosporella prunicola CBS 121167]KAF2138588.1 glycosyltransferase family 2 protein [Aplosporella prunicola CBS 121167]
MDPRRPIPNRSPSPVDPFQTGYQLEDRPYHPGGGPPLEIPMGPGPGPGTPGDRLAAQPTYSVENISGTYGHNEAYEEDHRYSPAPYMSPNTHTMPDYAIDPEAHHDAYYTQPYNPSPQHEPGAYWDEDDNRPMLQPDTTYGPDPHNVLSPGSGSPPPFEDYADIPRPTPSPAPIRRWKTVKEVQLFNGNLVLDCPIPPRLLNQVPHAQPPERDEFTHMRYSAATCDPSEFYDERFTLRQKLFAKPRHTELFIAITMYNEEDELFVRTLSGVIKNIEHMNSRTNSKTWGKDAWKKIVVCVVSDGRAKINPRTRAVLAGLGVYQDGIAKQQVNGKDVTAHVYEYTTQMAVEIKKGIVNVKKGNTPIQMLFCLKEKNQKKINSHRWFFQAFGTVLDPNICVLLDAGTKPGKDSIYQLWKAFDLEPMCAGACGEIKAMLVHGKKLLNPLVATQNFEYKMSNILDKPLESAFGFISVLPGAFSAYRYVALQNDKMGQGPLEKYFAGEKMHGANAGIFTANMYLAEDRILCFELVSKRNSHWILQYVKSATGETDVPVEMADFILQRRRWLNGSFFAAVYALAHSHQIFRSDHSFFRKMMFLIEFGYQWINMLFAWFGLGNFFLVFRILTQSLGNDEFLGTVGNILATIFEWAYIATVVTCFVLALGNRPQGSNKFYMTMVYFWVLIMAYLMFASIYITVISVKSEISEYGFNVKDLFQNTLFFTLIVSMASTYLLYFIVSFLFLDPWHMFTSFFQYLLMTPTYINILNVYAFCNTHDITWGTKGDDKAEKLPSVTTKPGGKVDVSAPTDDADLNTQYENELRVFATKYVEPKKEASAADKQEDYYKGFRSSVVLFWMFCNLALCAVVLVTAGVDVSLSDDDVSKAKTQRAKIYMSVILWSVAGLSAFRFTGAVWFLIVRMFRGV